MSILYNAYYVKTQQPPSKLQEKFTDFEKIPNSEWIVCDSSNDYLDGTFEGEGYLTQELSEIFGEVIFIALDTSNDQLDYEHSQDGKILRKLAWISDGGESTWRCVEGEVEDWELTSVFSEGNWLHSREMISYDRHLQLLPPEELEIKEQELQELWQNHRYVLNGKLPWGDANFGMVIQSYFFCINILS